MASGKTTNYGLNQWVNSDRVQMAEFNADNAKIDAALMRKAEIVCGSYTGTGTYGSANPTTLDFADTLGRAPKFVLVMQSRGIYQLLLVQGMTEQYCDYETMNSQTSCPVTWTETGVSWYNTVTSGFQLNMSGTTYHYVALA